MQPAQLVPFLLLVGAAVVQLPLVYALVGRDDPPIPIVLSAGLLSMGLAWSAGCSLEDRRKGTVRGIAAAGALGPLLGFMPGFPVAFDAMEQVLLLACSGLSAAGLVLLLRRWR